MQLQNDELKAQMKRMEAESLERRRKRKAKHQLRKDEEATGADPYQERLDCLIDMSQQTKIQLFVF